MKNLILILLISISFCACNKDDDNTIPPITQENSFSCFINGDLLLPKDRIGFPTQADGIRVDLYPDSNDWRLQFSDHDTHRSVTIFLKNVVTTGAYKVFALDAEDFGALILEDTKVQYYDTELNELFVSTEATGSIIVTELDVNSRIVLTFDRLVLDGLALDGTVNNDTLVVTDGKANINLETLN